MSKQNGIDSSKVASTSQSILRNSLGVRTLGPVPDLERHLPQDWWRTLFNSVYLKTDGDVVENDANTQKEVDLLIKSVGLDQNDRVLDLCCGQGRHCLELARRGYFHVVGVDRSRYLIRLARKRAKQENLSVTFHEGDARKFRLGRENFHCVALMGNSFGYFEREEDDKAVLEAVKRVLASRGYLILDLVDGDWMRANYQPRAWEWIDQNHLVCRERALAGAGRRLVSREVVVHSERGVIVDQFYAERLYNREQVRELLNELGFDSIRDHGALVGESERNQDLGMMANRMLLTAQAPRHSRSTSKRKPSVTEITVVLGDPRLPDEVKLNSQFNSEDFATINRVKDALAELSEFNFHYLDNHASLVTDLREDRPEFVLNLCDEGFNNDAFRELHVPALLELFNIPYSGAGPACLGTCYNKSIVRAVAESLEIPVPLETYFDRDDQSATIPSVMPALVKPNYGDSSIGITKDAVVSNSEELIRYLDQLHSLLPGRPVLIQEYLAGAEYSVGVIGNPGFGYHVLPILQVDFNNLDSSLPPILGYESKWDPESAYWNQINYFEATLDEEKKRQLSDYSIQLFERLECRDYARFDFRADEQGNIKLLEVNPNPGWCWDGKLNLMAGFGGLRYAEMLRLILQAGLDRIGSDNILKNQERLNTRSRDFQSWTLSEANC